MLRLGSFKSISKRLVQYRCKVTEARIDELGLVLPTINPPKGNYISFLKVGNMVYLSGHLPIPAEGDMVTGRLGESLNTKQGYEAAKLCGLQMIATLKINLGDLDKIKQVVKVNGFVNSTDTFTEQATVMNGCSDLFHQVMYKL